MWSKGKANWKHSRTSPELHNFAILKIEKHLLTRPKKLTGPQRLIILEKDSITENLKTIANFNEMLLKTFQSFLKCFKCLKFHRNHFIVSRCYPITKFQALKSWIGSEIDKLWKCPQFSESFEKFQTLTNNCKSRYIKKFNILPLSIATMQWHTSKPQEVVWDNCENWDKIKWKRDKSSKKTRICEFYQKNC